MKPSAQIQIITVVKNDLQGLQRTLSSLVVQNFDLNLLDILIVDGSSDLSVRDSLSNFNSLNLEYLYVEPRGVYNAMNAGISYLHNMQTSLEKFVLFLNAGAFFSRKDSLSLLLNSSASENIIVGHASLLNPKYFPKVNYPVSTAGTDDRYLNPSVFWLPHQGLIARWQVFQEIGGFDEDLKVASDYDWIIRALTHFGPPRIIPQELVVQVTDGLSTQYSFTGYIERLKLCDRYSFKKYRLPSLLTLKIFIREMIVRVSPKFFRQSSQKFYSDFNLENLNHLSQCECQWCIYFKFIGKDYSRSTKAKSGEKL